MQAPQASRIVRIGGLLIMISLALPYFRLGFSGTAGLDFRLDELDRFAVAVLLVMAAIALVQPRFAERQLRSTVYLLVSGALLVGLIYRIWISPPDSIKISDLVGGLGEFTVGGQRIEFGEVSLGELLGSVGGSFDPTFGAWLAMFGGFLFALGSLLEFRAAGAAPPAREPAPAPAPSLSQYQPAPPQAPPPQAPSPDPFSGQAPAAPTPPSPAPPPAPPPPSGPERPPGS